MRLLALVLLVGVAQAQGLTTLAPGQTGQKRTNYVLQSNTISTGTAATSPWTLLTATVATVAGAPPGGGTWAALTGSTGTEIIYQNTTTPSGKQFVASVWAKKASGTGGAAVRIYCQSGNVVTACTCARSGAGSCTADRTTTTTLCTGYVTDLGTTEERLSVVATCTNNITNPQITMYPAQALGVAGTTYYSGAQLEAGVTRPSKLCVTTTAAKTCRN